MRFFNGKGRCILCLFDNISFRFGKGRNSACLCDQGVGLAIPRSRVRVPLWPLAGFVLGRPELNSSATLVNRQLVTPLSAGFLTLPSSETQGQIVGAKESLNGRKNMARRKVKNGEKSPWGQCLTRPVPNGRRRSDF